MPYILIVGATRGLGASLANLYAADAANTVFGTTRSSSAPMTGNLNEKIVWLKDIDVSQEDVGSRLVNQLGLLGGGGRIVEGGVRTLDVVVRWQRRKPCRSKQSHADLWTVQIITAGYFATEDFTTGPKWEEEVKMYSKSCYPLASPVFWLLMAC
jgi:NAD(P)-dependent dehydrogenase (short-subunit alcohol dehydrogenase family)